MRRAVGLAVAGLVLATAGLAAWVLSAVGGVVRAGAAGRIDLIGLGLVAAGALCGLAMIITVRGARRAARIADRPAAGGVSETGGGLADAASPPATSAPPGPLPGRVPLAGRSPSRPDAEPAPQWPLEPAAEAPPSPQPAAAEPPPPWSPQPGVPEPPPWSPEPVVPEPAVAEPLPQWSPEPVVPELAAAEPLPQWSPEPVVPEPPPESAAQRPPGPAPEWAHEPAAEWASEPGPVPTAGQLGRPADPGPAPAPDEQPGEPPQVWWRPDRKPAVGWNPDSAEDWLRVLRGLRGSEQSHED
jgi:hypothetical protein